MLRVRRSLPRLLATALTATVATLLSAPPATTAAERPHVRVAQPVPGRVVDSKRVVASEHAVVNFAELAQHEAHFGAARPPVRARLFPEPEEPEEPISILSPGGFESPTSPLAASPSPSSSFMGLDDIPMVDSSYIVIPPDVGGAVGPTKLMSGHNNNYRIFNKSDGSVVGTVGTATFWAPSGETALNGLTDPRTLYDPYNGRWIAVMQSVTAGAGDILVGVSQTNDPSGNWFLYRFPIGFTLDFPIVGFNKNWISISINRYSIAGAFQRGINLVLDYGLARSGTGTGTLFTTAMNTHFCSAPCATYSATEETLFVVTHLSSSGATYTLDTISGTSSAPVYTAGGTLTRPGGGWVQPGGNLLPQSAPNAGTSACGPTPCPIECQDAQIRSAPVYRGGFLFYTQTVGLPSTGLTHTGVQWTKLNATGGALVDGGRIEDPTATSTNGGKWYAYPHIAVNSVGDFMVGYSQFSSAQHPATGYSMHLAADAAGTIRDPVAYKPGDDYYHKTFSTTTGRNRWGDFSQAQVDPSDDRSLWTVQEYAKTRAGIDDGNSGANSSRWSTYWANVAGPAPIVTMASGPTQAEGNSGLTPFVFTVTLSTGYSLPVTVTYQTSDGTATVAGNDYQAAAGAITIPAGATSGVISVNVVGDTNGESNETFHVQLTGATNGVIGPPNNSTGTIVNDDSFTITASAGANGTISPSGAVSVAPGGNQGFTIAPNPCYSVAGVLVDGNPVGALTTYTFTDVTANHSISATFVLNTYTITASAGAGGSITPNGAVTVGCGADQSFTIGADGTHAIGDVLVDGVSVGAVGTYTFSGVTADHTIAASFNAIATSAANLPYSGVSPGGVDMATGELILVMRPDLAIDGPMPLEFGRYYASRLSSDGLSSIPLGMNWLGTYDWSLSVAGPAVDVVTNRGRRIRFQQNPTTGYDLVTPTDQRYRLETVAGAWRFTDPSDRRAYLFDGVTHRLAQILDAHGNSLDLSYSGGRLSQVADGLGGALSFGYDPPGHLTSVSDGTRTVGFTHSGDLLTGVNDAGGHPWTYAYQSGPIQGLLMTVTEPLGNTPVTNAFDPSGRVATQSDALSGIATYAYDLPPGNVYTDALGNAWTYHHDSQNRLSTLLDPASGTTGFSYDTAGRIMTVTRPLGDETSFLYDTASGYPSTITRDDGLAFTYGYGSHVTSGATFFDVSTASYPDGASESYGRDAAGNLTDFTDKGGFHWLATYNARGQLLTETNPTSGVTTLSYDSQARLETAMDNAGNTTHYAYDTERRLLQFATSDNATVSFTHDALDHVTSVTDQRSKLWSYAYDDNGRLTTATDPLLQATGLTYDALDRVSQVVDPLGHPTLYAYDAAGHVLSVTDRSGRTTGYQYDTSGRLTGVVDPMGGTKTYSYDADSRVPAIQDPLGHGMGLTYDTLDRVTHATDAVGTPYDFTRDAMGRLLSASAPLGHVETFTYDARGLLASYVDVSSTLALAHTPLGRVSELTDPNQNGWPALYDPQGRPSSSADPLGRATSYEYDLLNRPIHVGTPDGNTQQIDYDPAGRVTGESYTNGPTFTYDYDDANRLVGATGATFGYDAAGRITSSNGLSFTYDPEGRMLSETLATGKVVTYTYDSRGLLSEVADWVGGTTSFTYDAAHRLTGITRPNGIAVTYQYDSADRLTQAFETNPGPTQTPIASIAITRDALGRPTSIDRRQPLMPAVTTTGTTSFAYDAASQISGVAHDPLGRTTGDGSRTFEWDGASRLTHYVAGADSPSFTYDAFDRPLSRTQGTQTESYVWNYAGATPTLASVTPASSTPRYYVYTPSGLLLYSVDGATGARRFYHFDESGNTIFLTNDAGSVEAGYAYTLLGDVASIGQTATNPFTLGAARRAMQLGASGIFRFGAEIYDAKASRVLSRIAVSSRVYNAELMPALDLPGAVPVSGLRSGTSPGSGQASGWRVAANFDANSSFTRCESWEEPAPATCGAGDTRTMFVTVKSGPDRYHTILAALTTRIPVYAPEWTDQREGDDGVDLDYLLAFPRKYQPSASSDGRAMLPVRGRSVGLIRRPHYDPDDDDIINYKLMAGFVAVAGGAMVPEVSGSITVYAGSGSQPPPPKSYVNFAGTALVAPKTRLVPGDFGGVLVSAGDTGLDRMANLLVTAVPGGEPGLLAFDPLVAQLEDVFFKVARASSGRRR